MQLREQPLSETFAGYFDEHDIADRRTWLVQTGGLGTGKGNDFGLVSDGLGFEDSPDCEAISSGLNSKGPHALAIGRQANQLQWGFYAAPDRMTPSARLAFLNALVWMKQFDGHRPLVRRAARSRQWLPLYAGHLDREDTSDRLRDYVLGQFPESAVERFGGSGSGLQKWFELESGYVYQQGRGGFRIDQDLKAIGLANRDPELLDWLATTLRETPTDDRALRIARRYLAGLGEDAADGAAVVAWLERRRERLFFSDVGGFRWFEDTRPDRR